MVTKTTRWAADDLDRLPDDGNRYEVVDGELFVTPAPSFGHQSVSAAFLRRLDAFVRAHGLGWVVFAPADLHFDAHNRVQPDLFVIPRTAAGRPRDWNDAPRPILVVEILSASTAKRDHESKRELYIGAGIPTYWIVDSAQRFVLVVRPGERDVTVRDDLVWQAAEAAPPLTVGLPTLFREALEE